MKTFRNIINLPYLLLAGFFFAGCYTQLESVNNEDSNRRDGDGDDYAYTDSTNDQDSGGPTGNNYFYDDGYRSSRYRMSFHYYYPSHYMWASSIWFDPWYDDFYSYPWDPWYRPGLWYPTIAYPYPYWYPRSGYYPHYGPLYGYGHWHGNNYPMYGGGAFEPGRRRTTGSTRGDEGGFRTRGSALAPSTIPVAGGVGSGGVRPRAVPEVSTTDGDRGTRKRAREEVPWWQRTRTPVQDSPDRGRTTGRARITDDNAPAVSRTREGRRARVENDPVSTVRRPGGEQKTAKQNGQKQVKQRAAGQRSPQAGSDGRGRQRSEPSYKSGSRQETPRSSSPPPRESGRSRSGNDGGNRSGGERSRRER